MEKRDGHFHRFPRHPRPPGTSLRSHQRTGTAGTRVIWSQRFEDAGQAERMAPIVIPANEQNLDRPTAEVLRGQRTGCAADDASA